MNDDLLTRVLAESPGPFALIQRPESAGGDRVDVLLGEFARFETLAELPLPEPGRIARHDVLVLIPYRQITERGFEAPDDGTPLLAMTVGEQASVPLDEVLRRIPDHPVSLSDGGGFDLDDASYAETARRIIRDEIGTGAGANFVLRRSFVADISDYSVASALRFFSRLLEQESGTYWSFIVHTGERTLVGASPERHISVAGGRAVMNPISGTYRFPSAGPELDGVMDFLADRKEADELYMVVDEELKMMARICDSGGQVVGPYLKEMARLAHTEYFIEGNTTLDPRAVLRETLLAPTVTGSPLESASRVIKRYEPHGRGYYSGVLALIGQDGHGMRSLDSTILIRTADIDGRGRMRIGVGATLVRHSDPLSEVAETRAKAAGLLAVLGPPVPRRFGDHPRVRDALGRRNETIASFWLEEERGRARPVPRLAGRKVLVVDAEDTFTAMIAHQLRAMSMEVTVVRFDEPYSFAPYDLVVMGPGPGDPRDAAHPKIAHLREAVDMLLLERRPFLAVCLSHQMLSLRMGLDLRRRAHPNQGVQREIDLFDRRERVGFYNTFAAHSVLDRFEVPGIGTVEACREAESGEVHALRGPGFRSMQFHAESVLTGDGTRIVSEALVGLLEEQTV
ncbi:MULTISPECIES: anthranilate synthase family protein [unclassified Streptomyces]|uniref:anthranilate synthase family protein n=1 Tax=unclassified Streptomyces TaxID=2593676 RepID=UPI000DAE27BC|nr:MULTISPECIES: anthranilate synthase family protein [unclassified Streptomyces]PZT74832.1 phenazine-specific anthranilate synthase component I [Streptomyces sp. AC1-42T]PZT82183.1 phenazine-specific anthranilate synthase component I [Streptomyces sp. AC1-42W]